MYIALVGPGIIKIPPDGFGAVETIIWDYRNELIKLGHQIDIINIIRNSPNDQSSPTTPYCKNLINVLNLRNYDFIHIHYDCLYHITPYLNCANIGITSHYPYIDNPYKHREDGYTNIFRFLITQNRVFNFVLAQKDIDVLVAFGATHLKRLNNGVNSSLFDYRETPLYNRTVYLGKISQRKNQTKYQSIPGVDFIGNIEDTRFDTGNPNYLGEWSRNQIHACLTDYTNLLLLSKGEADALVIKEALVCGLGVVVNRTSAENLDIGCDFITIIEDTHMDDLSYIKQKIDENSAIVRQNRNRIRDYGVANFDIGVKVAEYVNIVSEICTQNNV